MKYVSCKKACEHYGVCSKTIYRWEKANKIQSTLTKNGTKRFLITPHEENRKSYIYARVSSKKQEGDLKRQIKYIKDKYPEFDIVQDVGSGINFKRKGFNTLLDKVLKGSVEKIVISSRDRLCRFGFELIQNICKRFNTEIFVIDNEKNKSSQQELAEDLLSVVTVFTAKYHGSRKYSKLSKNTDLS